MSLITFVIPEHVLNPIIRRLEHMSAQLDALTVAVAANTAAVTAAADAIAKLRAETVAAIDPAAVQALADTVAADAARLSAAAA